MSMKIPRPRRDAVQRQSAYFGVEFVAGRRARAERRPQHAVRCGRGPAPRPVWKSISAPENHDPCAEEVISKRTGSSSRRKRSSRAARRSAALNSDDSSNTSPSPAPGKRVSRPTCLNHGRVAASAPAAALRRGPRAAKTRLRSFPAPGRSSRRRRWAAPPGEPWWSVFASCRRMKTRRGRPARRARGGEAGSDFHHLASCRRSPPAPPARTRRRGRQRFHHQCRPALRLWASGVTL